MRNVAGTRYSVTDPIQRMRRSLRSLEWLNFFLADVQTGLGPFLAAYLASSGWNPGRVGYALTFAGLVAVAMQTPAGAVIDSVHRKRALLGVSLSVLVAGAFLLMGRLSPMTVFRTVPYRRFRRFSSAHSCSDHTRDCWGRCF